VGRQYRRRLGDVSADREWHGPDHVAVALQDAGIGHLAIDLLSEQVGRMAHASWPDDVSLRDNDWIDPGRILGPNQITDAYLLALVVKSGGRLATFDQSISLGAVRRAEPRHLAVISGTAILPSAARSRRGHAVADAPPYRAGTADAAGKASGGAGTDA
jgi:hypothetical protein